MCYTFRNMKNNFLGLVILVVVAGFLLQMPIPRSKDGAALITSQIPPQLIVPRGEMSYAFGNLVDIRWSGGDPDSSVRITLINETGSEEYRVLANATPNDGEELWYVDMPPGQYKLALEFCVGCTLGTARISSDRVFTVTEGLSTQLPPEASTTPTNQGLVFYYPRGGETLHAGTVETIRWYGGDPSWDISLRLLSGSDLSLQQVIGENIEHSHWFAWSVPYVISGKTYYLELVCTNCSNDSTTRVLSRYPITIKNP